jgi:calcineurin-like phosphoesterase family protein
MKVRFIGDVHGKWPRYKKLLKGVENSLQVGDFGVGFRNPHTEKEYSDPPYDSMMKGNHFFIRGNHDNPSACSRHPFWIRDGKSAFGRDDIFCVGGAVSIDKDRRTEGYDWWHNEELSYKELCEVTDVYELVKPRIVVSHECPDTVISHLVHKRGLFKYDIPCTTRKCFDNMLEIHKPDLWVHGHWHFDHHTVFNGVEFIGLGELSYLDLDI